MYVFGSVLQLLAGYLGQALVFLWCGAQREGLSFCFFRSFWQVLAKFSFQDLGDNFMEFGYFPDIF